MNKFEDLSSLKKLLPQLLKHRKGVIQIVSLQIIWGIVELILPFLTQAIVDKGINQQDLDFIYLILLAQLMLFVGNISTDMFKSWMLRHIGVRINMNLVNSFLKRIIIKNVFFFYERKEGGLLQLVNDNFRIEKFLTDSILSIFNAIFRIILYGMILSVFSSTISITFLVSVILSISWDFIFLKERKKFDELTFNIKAKVRTELLEIFNGITDIKVSNQEWSKIANWQKLQNLHSSLRLNKLRIHQLYKGGTLTINQLRNLLIMFLSATYVINGTITLGAMLAIQYIMGQLNSQVLTLMEFVEHTQDAKLSLGRLEKVMTDDQIEYYPNETTRKQTFKENVKVEGLYFDYNQTPCLKEINLDIPYGSKVALVGESGSGKSTLLKLILKLLNPDKGKITIGKYGLRGIENDTWRDNYSVVLQDGFIFNRNLKYNITYQENDSEIDFDKMQQAIKLSCLEEVLSNLENGFDTMIGRGGKSLSKGQGQRVLLARAIYNSSNYLFMDEPTSALDTITSKKVIQNLQSHYKNETVVIATHKLRLAEKMDLILLMKSGEIIEKGTHLELMNKKGLYHELYIS